VAEETLREIISGAGFDPLEGYVRSCLIDALNSALKALPDSQRQVVEAQVFGGKTLQRISRGHRDEYRHLKARKRYAVGNLSKALRHWVSH
jgi:DNA-directed RNA polymerase specialized sigma24 family protein